VTPEGRSSSVTQLQDKETFIAASVHQYAYS
jgi:hypothetical protein